MKYFKIILRSFVEFFQDNGIMLAGSLSYFSMMAFVPFCIFLITMFGHLLGHYQEFYEFFYKRLIQFFPEITSDITNELGKLIHYKGIGTLSLILYGFLSYQVFASLQSALNTIFKVKKKRTFLWSIIDSLIIITLILLILIISFMATSLIPLLKTLRQIFPELRIGMITGYLIQYVIPFFMVFLTISVIFIFFPKIKVRIRHAFIGALFTTLLLEVAKHIFTWYVRNIVEFGTIYGSLSAFVVFLLWGFYSSCIFLIGAEIVHNLANYKK